MHRCCMSPSATDCASSSEIERPQIRPVAYTATMTFLQEGQKATVLQLPAAEKILFRAISFFLFRAISFAEN